MLRLSNGSEEVSAKRRLRIIIGVGILAISATYYATSSTETTSVPSAPPTKQQVSQNAGISSKPVLPSGYQSDQATRNPFNLPPEYRAKAATKAAAATSNSTTAGNFSSVPSPSVSPSVPEKPKSSPVNLRLTGIIRSQDIQMAIIQTGGKSFSYQVNDAVGGYRVTAITDDSVILSNGSDEKILNLRAALKSGGNKSAK